LNKPRFPGVRITTNANQLVSYHTEARITEGGVFYPITPSTEMGESYQLAFSEGETDVFDPTKGETFRESLDLQGNPQPTRDWAHIKSRATGLRYQYTTAHWAVTEARFRRHFKKVQDSEGLVFLEELLLR
jgi:hypothetical protein